MTLVEPPFAVVSYTTCELVTLVTVSPGGGTVWDREENVMDSVVLYLQLCTVCGNLDCFIRWEVRTVHTLYVYTYKQ